jgi:hypothetical protein
MSSISHCGSEDSDSQRDHIDPSIAFSADRTLLLASALTACRGGETPVGTGAGGVELLVGPGVRRGVGLLVGPAVGRGVGLEVVPGVGRGVGLELGPGVVRGVRFLVGLVGASVGEVGDKVGEAVGEGVGSEEGILDDSVEG